MAEYRSDENQKLTAKVLIEWSEARLKDLKRLAPYGQNRTARELLNMRAVHQNILVNQRSRDDQIKQIGSSTDSPFAYCIHPVIDAMMNISSDQNNTSERKNLSEKCRMMKRSKATNDQLTHI